MSYKKDCETCKHEPDFIRNIDQEFGRCKSRGIEIFKSTRTNGTKFYYYKQDTINDNCPPYDPKPKQCTCDAGGPVLTIQLCRAWDNGGYWHRIICCDCGKRGRAGISHIEAIENWNNDKLEISKEEGTLRKVRKLIELSIK